MIIKIQTLDVIRFKGNSGNWVQMTARSNMSVIGETAGDIVRRVRNQQGSVNQRNVWRCLSFEPKRNLAIVTWIPSDQNFTVEKY